MHEKPHVGADKRGPLAPYRLAYPNLRFPVNVSGRRVCLVLEDMSTYIVGGDSLSTTSNYFFNETM